MKRFIPRRPSPAMIVAVIALVAALTGTAFAGGILTAKKFKRQAVRGPITYVSKTAAVESTPGGGGPGTHLSVDCPGSSTVIGGGMKVADEANMLANDDYPTATGWAGTAFNSAIDGQARNATVTAICATSRLVTGQVPPN